MTSPEGALPRRPFRHPLDKPAPGRARLALLAAFGAMLLSGGGLALMALPIQGAGENAGIPPPEAALIAISPLAPKTVRVTRIIAAPAGPEAPELAPEDPRWAVELAGEAGTENPLLDEPDAATTAAIAPKAENLTAEPKKNAEKPVKAVEKAKKPAAAARYDIGAAWTGFATEHVKLRAGPDNDAAVLMVVPSSAAVTVHGCKAWCNISYRGKRGFVFKTFLRTAEAVSG